MHRAALKRYLQFLAWVIALSLGFAAVYQPAPAAFAAAPPTFSVPSYQFYGGVSGPSWVTVGDFNRDGIQDLAVTNFYNNNVSILLGNGDGTFGEVLASYATGTNPSFVAVGDFNRDGVPDLAVTNRWTSDISIFVGKGDGTFFDAVNYLAGNQPHTLAIGDFNEDGIQDLAVGNVEGATLAIFIDNGDGTFGLTDTYLPGGRPTSVIVRDFNRDGHQDLALVNWGADNTVSIMLGNGSGAFAPAVKYPVGEGSNPSAIAVGDFNEDGIEDLAVANYAADYVAILRGNGDGTFAAPVHFSLPGFTHVQVVVEDFNADGHQDLVVLSSDSNSWSILVGNGDGTFAAPINYVEPDPHTDPRSIAVGDFNRDGKPDLTVTYYWDPSISVFLNSTPSLAPVAEPPGLVSWWPMDSSTLDIADGNNSSQENALHFVPGKVNSGITFDAGGYIEIPHAVNLALQQFTISAWARPDGPGPNNDTPGNVLVQKGILFSQGGGTAVSVGIWWSVIDGRFRFAIGEVGPEWIASSSIFPPGHFYQVAATYDGVTAKLYIDGVLEGQLALAKTMFYEPSVPWTMGSTAAHIRAVGYPRTWNGIIDEVEVYNRALAATEIQAIVDAGSAGHLAANAGPNQSVPEGMLVQLDGSRSRPLPGPDVRYDWIQVAGPVVTLNLTDPVHPTFTAPSVPPDGQTLTFQLAVTAFGVTSELSLPVNVRVVNVNHAPVAITSAPAGRQRRRKDGLHAGRVRKAD